MIMIAERIKTLRENCNISQAQLATKLGITRSSVNAWEMGISIPSTQYIVELSRIFKVSTDYLLCVSSTKALDVDGLTEGDISMIYQLIAYLCDKNQ